MTSPETPIVQPATEVGPGMGAGAWLGSRSVFDAPDPAVRKRQRNAGLMSFSIHTLFALLLIWGVIKHNEIAQIIQDPKPVFDVVYLEAKGPGGGGGGSPQPAPPKKLELPKPTPTPPAVPVPVPTPTVPPPPSLNAPVMTAPTAMLTASGVTGTIDVPLGGGGKGGGIGSGNGNGLGPGEGGGFGGGAYRPGNGVESPTRIREEKPQYTAEAMRAKIQGTVELEALIAADGNVAEVRVTRSLDRVFGLDESARQAVFRTKFLPCKRQGVPVACLVTFELQFTLR
jgi:periplasmic protein TonB